MGSWWAVGVAGRVFDIVGDRKTEGGAARFWGRGATDCRNQWFHVKPLRCWRQVRRRGKLTEFWLGQSAGCAVVLKHEGHEGREGASRRESPWVVWLARGARPWCSSCASR